MGNRESQVVLKNFSYSNSLPFGGWESRSISTISRTALSYCQPCILSTVCDCTTDEYELFVVTPGGR